MEDIITALATAWGEGGISIVRISGQGCTALADKLFRSRRTLSETDPRYMSLGKLYGSSGEPFDEVLAVRFGKGASYTGEECVEIHCHGGTLPAQRCIEELCALGARLALPGEFTRRAFISGRIDLSQAEAVLGVIRAKSDEALRASTRTLQGEFKTEIKKFLDELTLLAAQLEVDLDFPEEGEGMLSRDECLSRISSLISGGEDILSRCRSGLILREGIRVAIVGRPNVGKSSLLNALLKEARAIVTPVPGTTRDRIEEILVHKGVPIRITDTAGIRETTDEVESIGVSNSMKSLTEADLRVWVVDTGEKLEEEDIQLGIAATALPHIIVLNKSDLPPNTGFTELSEKFPKSRIISVSALKSEGIEELKDIMVTEVSGEHNISGSYGVTARQIECLGGALYSIKEAQHAIEQNIGDDLAIACISDVRAQISSLLGLDASEDLLDVIFGSFCVGK